HILVGVLWIGHLYFFNFVNGHFAATLDADTKKKVVPELMPRALFWFRWGAAWTWITGVLLIALVFYHSKIVFNEYGEWNTASLIMIAVTFLGVFVYDILLNKMGHTKPFVILGFVLSAAIVIAMSCWANFSYRGYNIHIAALFGTIMAYNVWVRIWPLQQKIISAIKSGEKADPAWGAVAGMRSKHNTYLSVPLFWGMINSHTTFFAGGNLYPDQWAWVSTLVMIALGWHIVWQLYKKSAKVKGF
ncbi:MAG: urate hydroxylase PuuD, partial [Bdellovibrionales bacterium]|nr:urate hydroxylase PuuD [Bdellovibrionales bacterium]